jgi:hypothetical protein
VHQEDVVGHPRLPLSCGGSVRLFGIRQAAADLKRAACISEARTKARVRQKGCVSLAQPHAYRPEPAGEFPVFRAPIICKPPLSGKTYKCLPRRMAPRQTSVSG